MSSSNRLRVAAAQYFIRPVTTYQQFEEQVSALVCSAADYRVRLLVFPEYFTIQLLTLGDIGKPITEQVRRLAQQEERFVAMFERLARKHSMYIVAGSLPTMDDGDDRLFNESYIFSPSGKYGLQPKLHMTRWEREEWKVSAGRGLRIFETDFGKLAINICYDVEFPELAREAARQGCFLLVCPSCTDDRQGFLRVRYCAQARTIENTMYVIHSCTVGSLPQVPAVSLNYGCASILTPSDFPFARDGILAEGNINTEMLVIGELNLDTIIEARERGTVLPLHDSQTTAEVMARLETIELR
jgi:predicted amidohydrolase